MKLKFIVAGLLTAISFGAFAADQTVVLDLSPAAANTFSSTVPGDGVLSGGLDVISFAGLNAGVYNIDITLSGQNLTFSDLTNLNGFVASDVINSGKFHFVGVSLTGPSPFTLNLMGTALAGAKYSGEVTISAVPEPETYGMLLGGLALMGVVARRKAKKAA
ncbi:FxDxF family PEP-CTERM protein [Rugamonas rubra]|uniref:PEP-CTERM protein-sorting domain-containing protein n=1 Tax=Rugamonas rubra TaxID=758825 RepID=A0A1I4L293_9BURK|nr:FxDxF family PEP-CTERM protein [Rugamonas rubra]SFL85130.1 PEP-CTERM protein-sorting domain-containing protein [Rugamonas rubra]